MKPYIPEKIASSTDEFLSIVGEMENSKSEMSAILYRGQSNSCWDLETTLERSVNSSNVRALRYYESIDSLKHEINAILNKNFIRRMTSKGYPFNESDFSSMDREIPELEYLAYLRHHGFPSPLMDWTASPYIALYFATQDLECSKDSSVYVYQQPKMQSFDSDQARIHLVGPLIDAHKRHFLQQASYLIPKKLDTFWKFVPFEAAVNENQENLLVTKIIINGSAKIKSQKMLKSMNLNPYSLFSSEDSFVLGLDQESHIEGVFERLKCK